MSKGNGGALLLGLGAVAALVLMTGGAKADEAREAAELADKQRPPQPVKPNPPTTPASKPKPRPEPAQQPAPASAPPPQRPSQDVVFVQEQVPQLPAGYNAAAAKAEAPALAKHIRQRGANYTRKAVATFQLHAGIKPDGIYGPQSASALTYWAGAPAPKPLFKGSVKTYTPPEG